MIVAMKKVAVLAQTKDQTSLVDRLASLGVVHVEPARPPQGEDLVRLKEDQALVDAAIGILSETEFKDGAGTPAPVSDWRAEARRIVDSRKRFDQLEEYARALEARIAFWKPWGDFDPEALKTLGGRGIHVHLYQVPVKEIGRWPAAAAVKVCSTEGGLARCALVSREPVDMPFAEIAWPKTGLNAMEKRSRDDARSIASIVDDLRSRRAQIPAFREVRQRLAKEIELKEAVAGMGAEAGISYLTGFAPADVQGVLMKAAAANGWGLWVTDPTEDDRVPVLLREPGWVRLIDPVLRFLDVTPGYTELDVSPVFLVFFSLFFGMLIGDAGYGLVYGLLTFAVQRKMGDRIKDKTPFKLFYLLSACAFAWGLLTGTFFGQGWLLKAGFHPLAPRLNDFKFIQAFCFFVGATHLTIGHLWRTAVQWPAKTAYAEIGWASVIWAAFFMAKTLLLGDPFPGFGKFMIAGGLGLVIFFANPRKSVLATVGAGLGTVALSLMNNFTDVVSYIRLFAVGLAGVAISDAFNSIAAGAAQAGGLALLGSAAILVVGHALNIVLGPMSVLVHGVRLNVLEFSGHAGLTWSGVRYRPLKRSS